MTGNTSHREAAHPSGESWLVGNACLPSSESTWSQGIALSADYCVLLMAAPQKPGDKSPRSQASLAN